MPAPGPLPVTPDEVAQDAARAAAAGAGAVHVHPKDDDGTDTLDARRVGAVVSAVRAAVPGLLIRAAREIVEAR